MNEKRRGAEHLSFSTWIQIKNNFFNPQISLTKVSYHARPFDVNAKSITYNSEKKQLNKNMLDKSHGVLYHIFEND